MGKAGKLDLEMKEILRSFEHIAIQDHFSKQGTVNEILEDEHVDIKSLLLKCEELLNGKKEN